ncbi:gluconate transporter [Rathayibacter rathayi]|uniref:Gluconate transporter n=1 Tax=Rathayibacter rathayi TaxID=33887 RepID=A0ABD6WA31_RATRA|nr:gluconate:H+ symporter [Rathayibacter rathayi]AZZ48573.1 gluconate transporter [Rathayibacter rathayi]MWV74887.1 gluconate transporter [Rathayibacter rathayi NCPPB 2980 = VKM Ac-1601]PPF14702.1 gluconate transporter [Rathayibacter rathayi]PPG69297.1 gluconate transporter [Rathayibacter rathayi]PPG79604.1 gluconate transporter [Rathayibacter rathayi]
MTPTLLTALRAAAEDGSATTAGQGQLILAAVIGIAVIVVLITWLKLHPFVSLLVGALTTGLIAGLAAADTVAGFALGFGTTMGGVGILIGLGAMYGKLLADSGGADRIVDTLISRSSTRALPWMMGFVGALIGLPMFFEVGLVLLIPVVILVARRSGLSLMTVAIPTLAGLSVMHGLVPPHPGPLVAIDALGANLGVTLAFGVLVAIPTVVVAGPLFGRLAARWAPVETPPLFGEGAGETREHRPGFAAAVASILLPVILMLGKAIADIAAPGSTVAWKGALDFLGTPTIALGIALLAGLVLLGRGGRMDRTELQASLSSSLPPIAGILLIVGAGGGFKQVLVDTGIGGVVAQLAEGSGASALLLAWLVAVVIRVATGSATVATVTAAGILQPLTESMDGPMVALMVLAIGAGSVFLSHVNDAGFWLVKEYLGLSIGQTLKTWTVMECLVSVTGLAGVLLIGLFVGGI